MQVHQSMVGYERRPLACALYGALVICTVGLFAAIGFLFPQTIRWTLRRCSLDKADFVLTELVNKRRILSRVYEVQVFSEKAQNYGARHDHECSSSRLFVLLLATYKYSATAGTFLALPAMPLKLPHQICCARSALLAIEQGADWTTFNPTHSWSRRERTLLYGRNTMAAGKPNLFFMLFNFMLHPIYTIQYVELAFTMYEQYYYYAVVLLGLTFSASAVSVKELYKRRLQLYNAVQQQSLIPLVQDGHVRGVSSRRLVPGDVVVLLRGKATCDMVLLQGGCLVEESVLSGEAAQVRKISFAPSQELEESASVAYDPDTHQTCTVFAGTYVQQVWNEGNTDEEVLAMVVRTGLCTAMGDMLRQVMAPLNDATALTDPFIKDLLRYCSLALLLQIGISLLAAPRASRSHLSTAASIKRAADVLIAAVPTSIPAVITVGMFRCLLSLKSRHIEIHHIQKVKTVAAVDCAVFDKTGTLTGSMPQLHSMVPVKAGAFAELEENAMRWPSSLKQCAAVCNSLNLVNRHHVTGESSDFTAFKACEARFLDRNLVALPLKPWNRKSSHMTNLTILRRFEFRSQLLRSGVIARDSTDSSDDVCFFIRGAPGAIEGVVGPNQVPDDYHKKIDDLARSGFRILAMCKGRLKGLSKEALARLSQEQLEARVDRFTLLGLLVLSNSLRPDSKETITKLQQQAGLRTLMATGDYHHTALAVARGVGMVPPEGQVVIIQKALGASQLELAESQSRPSMAVARAVNGPADTARHTRRLPSSVSFARHPGAQAQAQAQSQAEPLESAHQGLLFEADRSSAAQSDALQALTAIAQGEAQCCVTGPALEQLLQLGDLPLLETVMRNVVVFSRMKPHQKGQVMDLLSTRGLHQLIDGQQQHLPGLGKTCMYCGDGINDLLALATADVGVAIGAGDVSAAAVISTRQSSIAGCVTVLRETRAAQAIKLAAIKFTVLSELSLSMMLKVTYLIDGSVASQRQRAVLDVVTLTLGCVCSLRPAIADLNRSRPQQWLFGLRNAVLLPLVALLFASTHAMVCWYLTTQSWFHGGTGSSDKNVVTTLCWIVCITQLNAMPILTFAAGTADFCQRTSPLETGLNVVYSILVSVCCLIGPSVIDKFNYWHFYKMPWPYMPKSTALGAAATFPVLVLLLIMRKGLDRVELRRQEGRIVPSPGGANPASH